MSECVVRMEMPKSCKKCISTNCIWGKEGSDYLDVIVALQDFRRANNAGFPDFCPIICSLPEGHGDLVDRDVLLQTFQSADYETYNDYCEAFDTAEAAETIVPAERMVIT